MTHSLHIDDRRCPPSAVFSRARRGISSFEVLVALSLLITALSLSVPLIVRHNRLLVSARHYRLACEELSNQLERLTALPADDLPQAMDELTVSEFTAAHLPQAELTGSRAPADIGERITLAIVWDELPRRPAPLVMTAWIFPDAASAPASDDSSTDTGAETRAEAEAKESKP